METIPADYLIRGTNWLLTTTLMYFLMNGAQIFETAVIVPKWTSNPPESLQLLRGRYGLNVKPFWIILHSLHEITFVLAIIFCWKLDPVRNWLVSLFIIHFLVRVWTILYFAPNIIDFQKMPAVDQLQSQLARRTRVWRNLNYVRVAVFILISLALIPLCVQVLSMYLK